MLTLQLSTLPTLRTFALPCGSSFRSNRRMVHACRGPHPKRRVVHAVSSLNATAVRPPAHTFLHTCACAGIQSISCACSGGHALRAGSRQVGLRGGKPATCMLQICPSVCKIPTQRAHESHHAHEQTFPLVDLTPVRPCVQVPISPTFQQGSSGYMLPRSLAPPACVVKRATSVPVTPPPVPEDQAASATLSHGRCQPLHGSKTAQGQHASRSAHRPGGWSSNHAINLLSCRQALSAPALTCIGPSCRVRLQMHNTAGIAMRSLPEAAAH